MLGSPALRMAAASLGLTMLLGGCGIYNGAVGTNASLIRGIEPRVEDLSFADVAAAQTRLIAALQEQANLKDVALSAQDPRWALVLKAGIQVVDGRCDQYLDTLSRFNHEQRAARKGLTAATAATASIMGLTGAAGGAISVVATALGLVTTLFDANVDSVLFQIEVSALRNVVLQGRQKYIDELLQRTDGLRSVDTRPDMMIALQGYLTQCSPAAIEANINNAANGSPFAVTVPALTGRNAIASGASSISTGTPSVQLLGPSRAPSLSGNVLVPPRQTPAAPNRSTVNILGASTLDRASLAQILRALGVAPVADEVANARRASLAIAQVQLALGRHDARWLREPRGTLEGTRTRDLLLSLGPMPAQFHTPFERFTLGAETSAAQPDGSSPGGFATLDRVKMLDLRERLGLPFMDLPPGADLWDGVRPKLDALRREKALLPAIALVAGVTDPGALDAPLYDQIDPRRSGAPQ